jgi:electron transfer flavoprotein beta subunit
VNIAVCAKVAPDTAAQIRTKADGSGIETSGIKFVVSPYDSFAIEEAVQLTEKKIAGAVHLFSVGGGKDVLSALRGGGLAVGALDLTLIEDPAVMGGDALVVARALAAAIKAGDDIGLVLCGKQAVDDDNVQVPAMIAELLGWPQVSMVSDLEVEGTTFRATRNVGGGVQEVVQGSLPAVITCDKGMNTPRYAKLPQIMKAKRKKVHKASASSLGLSAADTTSAVTVSSYSPPPARPAGRVLQGELGDQVKELVTLLRDEAKVL